jgi:hypothetical protein
VADGQAQVPADHLATKQLPGVAIGRCNQSGLNDQRGLFDRFEDGEREDVLVEHGAVLTGLRNSR